MEYKEIIDIIAYVIGALGLGGFSISRFKQKRNGGTVRENIKEIKAEIKTIKDDVSDIKVDVRVCKELSKRKGKR
jgi:uncharacterized protein (DUF111 family)